MNELPEGIAAGASPLMVGSAFANGVLKAEALCLQFDDNTSAKEPQLLLHVGHVGPEKVAAGSEFQAMPIPSGQGIGYGICDSLGAVAGGPRARVSLCAEFWLSVQAQRKSSVPVASTTASTTIHGGNR